MAPAKPSAPASPATPAEPSAPASPATPAEPRTPVPAASAHDAAPAAPEPVPPGELLATVSHELRQPLASIRGFTEMLLAHWADFAETDKIEMLKEILHDAVRVGRLVDELLDVSRLESGRVTLYRRPTDIGEVVARVVTNLKLSYPALEAVVELPRRFPPVFADPFKLEQVFTNIVENACKHGSAGTVRIAVSSVSSGSYEPGPGPGRARGRGRPAAEIAISDDGPGISAEELPHVTEKFYRSAQSNTNGLGLGLWVSQGIVEAHGGQLVATSGGGGGTTVRFTIPLDDAVVEPPALAAGAHLAGGGGKSRMHGAAGTGKLAGS
jgi:signal transduction histidine kinase